MNYTDELYPLTPNQRNGPVLYNNGFTIISGYPGSGKTYQLINFLKQLIQVYQNQPNFQWQKLYNTGPIQRIYYISQAHAGDITLQNQVAPLRNFIEFYEPDEAQELCKELKVNGQENGKIIQRQKKLLETMDRVQSGELEINDEIKDYILAESKALQTYAAEHPDLARPFNDWRQIWYPQLIIRPHYILCWDDSSNNKLVQEHRKNNLLDLILTRRHVGAAQIFLCIHGLHSIYSPIRQQGNTFLLFQGQKPKFVKELFNDSRLKTLEYDDNRFLQDYQNNVEGIDVNDRDNKRHEYLLVNIGDNVYYRDQALIG